MDTHGCDWTKKKFPMKTVEDIKLSGDEISSHDKECLDSSLWDSEWIDEEYNNLSNSYFVESKVPGEVEERYQFSNYIIDPNRFRLRKVVRILALVMMFITKLTRKN